MRFTILGANGFIGSNLTNYLKTKNCEIFTPNISEIQSENLGHVIYCIGITSDFRERPYDTVNSHVSLLNDFLKNRDFESFLYLSSTRVYMNSSSTNEANSLIVNPNKFTEIYNISKIMGESICLSSKKPNIRIARLSNVIGKNFESDDFIFSLIHDAIKNKEILLHSQLKSEKDYILVNDVVEILYKISMRGKSKIYNIASGKNLSVEKIMELLKKLTSCKVQIDNNASLNKFKEINIEKIKNEFEFKSKSIEDVIHDLVIEYRDNYSKI
jgi:nucleoside-diphosphate-sugar epimerase